jgi:S1-C subfamily serine protease
MFASRAAEPGSLVRRVAPAVAAVTSYRRPPGWFAIDPGARFPDAPLPQEAQVAGAGVIVNADLGLIATSCGRQCREAIGVALADGRRFDATILAHSEHDDLTVLRIAPARLTAVGLPDEGHRLVSLNSWRFRTLD